MRLGISLIAALALAAGAAWASARTVRQSITPDHGQWLSARPPLVGNHPVGHVLPLRVRRREGKTASVRADPLPLVAVDTMAFPHGAKQSGVQVGDRFYPSKENSWAQLVTLDRGTLEPVTGKLADLANKAYFCETPWPCPDSRKALSSDLARLGRDELAIVSSPYSSDGRGDTPFGLESALARIGVSPTGYDQRQDIASPGGVSAIGVPGTQPAEGDWRSVPSRTEGAGRMRDYLVRNNEREYVFWPRDRIEFATQAPGSNDDTNVIKVGDQSFNGDLRDKFGGLQVVIADQRTLTATSRFYNTPSIGDAPPALEDLAALLKRANDGSNLVFIASRGGTAIGVSKYDIVQQELRASLRLVADQIEKLGGTRRGIFTALDPGLNRGNSYSLLGWSHAGAGRGVETLGPKTNRGGLVPLNTAPLAGTLARTGPNYAFEVESSRSIPPEGSGPDPSLGATELAQIAGRPPSESGWPEHGDAGRTAAVRWIGNQVFGTDDPRGQYWTVPFVKDAFDYGYWSDATSRIGKLDYAKDPGFTEADLGWAKAELQSEIGWLVSTHRYLDNLSTPFAKGQLQSWADFQHIANSIRDRVGVSPDEKAHAEGRAVFNGFRQLVDVFPGPQAKAVEAANAIYSMVADLVEINGEPAEDEFQARADELGVKLAERLGAAQAMLERQLPNIIAADYDKLKTVGQCTSSDPKVWAGCPFDHSDWQYTQDDQTSAAKGLRTQLEISAYASLLPVKYTAYQLPPWWRARVSDDFYGFNAAFRHWTPFHGLPDSAQMAKPIYRNLPTYSHTVTGGPQTFGPTQPWKSSGETWEITALGYVSGDGTIIRPWVMHFPEASVTDRLFRSTADDGLGVDPETFFDVNFTSKPLSHYPERDTPTGWCALERDPCGS